MAINLLVQLGIYAASALASKYLIPKPPYHPPIPGSLGDFDMATSTEDRAIPILYGTCALKSPNVLWYGDLSHTKIIEKGQVLAYHYFMGLQFGLCMGPIDDVLGMTFDDQQIHYSLSRFPATWNSSGGYWEIVVSEPKLFGNDGGVSDGVAGTIRLYKGSTDQAQDAYLAQHCPEITGANGTRIIKPPEGYIALAAADVPAYRGLCHAVLDHFYIGNATTVRPISFVLKRCPNGLGLTEGRHEVPDTSNDWTEARLFADANVACVLWEMLTADYEHMGSGVDADYLDRTSFVRSGNALYAEGIGYSAIHDTPRTVREFIDELLRLSGGVLYVNPSNGLLTFDLLRDAVTESVPVLDPSNCEVLDFDPGSWEQTSNLLRLHYTDRARGFTETPVVLSDDANIAARGVVIPEDVSLRGVSTASAAQAILARSSRPLFTPSARMSLRANRTVWGLHVGSRATLNWSPLGISGLSIRVVKLNGGHLSDGSIRFEAVQDVFDVSDPIYATPPGTQWVDPRLETPILAGSQMIECPAALVPGLTSTTRARNVGLIMAQSNGSNVDGVNVLTLKDDGTFNPALTIRGLTPLGYLASPLLRDNTTYATVSWSSREQNLDIIASVSDEDFATGKNLLYVDGEFIAFNDVTPGTMEEPIEIGLMARGCLDTIPKDHAAGAPVWFVSYGYGTVGLSGEPSAGHAVANFFKVQPFNSYLTPSLDSIEIQELVVRPPGRPIRPVLPTDIRINGQPWPENIGGNLSLSWVHRNRLDVGRYDEANATDEPEPGATYTISVIDETGRLIKLASGLTGTDWIYPLAQEVVDNGRGVPSASLRIILKAMRSTVESYETFDWTVTR